MSYVDDLEQGNVHNLTLGCTIHLSIVNFAPEPCKQIMTSLFIYIYIHTHIFMLNQAYIRMCVYVHVYMHIHNMYIGIDI